MLKKILPIFLTLLCCFWLTQNIKATDYQSLFSSTQPKYLFLALIFCALSLYFRAHRWHQLFLPQGLKPSLTAVFHSTSIGILMSMLVLGSGEITRIGLLHKYTKIPAAQVFGTLTVERLLDLIILLPMLVMICFMEFGGISMLSFKGIFTFLLISLVAVFLFYLLKNWTFLHSFIAKKPFLVKTKAQTTLILNEFLNSLKQCFKDKKALLTFLLLTLIMRSAAGFQFYYLAQMFPETAIFNHLNTFNISTLCSGGASFIPTQAGIGAWHWFASKAFEAHNIEFEKGIVIATAIHLWSTLMSIFLGILSFLAQKCFFKHKRNKRTQKSFFKSFCVLLFLLCSFVLKKTLLC
jgi:glycosyltransferase 2 family protein